MLMLGLGDPSRTTIAAADVSPCSTCVDGRRVRHKPTRFGTCTLTQAGNLFFKVFYEKKVADRI